MNDLEKKMLVQLTIIQSEINYRKSNYNAIEELERKIAEYRSLNERSVVEELNSRTELRKLSDSYSGEGTW